MALSLLLLTSLPWSPLLFCMCAYCHRCCPSSWERLLSLTPSSSLSVDNLQLYVWNSLCRQCVCVCVCVPGAYLCYRLFCEHGCDIAFVLEARERANGSHWTICVCNSSKHYRIIGNHISPLQNIRKWHINYGICKFQACKTYIYSQGCLILFHFENIYYRRMQLSIILVLYCICVCVCRDRERKETNAGGIIRDRNGLISYERTR